MINLSDKLTAKTIEHIVAESNEIAYHDGDVSSSGNTVADKLTNLAHNVNVVSNDEFLVAFIDNTNNLLGGIKKDGSWTIPHGIPTETQTELDTLKNNTSKLIRLGTSDYAWAICDEKENVFLAGNNDGSVYMGKGVPNDVQTLIDEINSKIVDIKAKTDNLSFNSNNDTIIKNGLISSGGDFKLYLEETDQLHSDSNILFSVSDKNGNLICTVLKDASLEVEKLTCVNNAEFKSNVTISGVFSANTIQANGIASTEEDCEFIYAILDNNKKVLWGIRNTGNIYSLGITEGAKVRLDSVDKEITNIENELLTLSNRGVDWSNSKSIRLDIPSVPAKIEITGTIPTSKYYQTSGKLRYSDCYGNTFTKEIMWNVQGNISAGFDKKNWGIDLFNSIADDDAFEVTFGNWVAQDSFHLKAYISDFWKIRSLGVYRHVEQLSQARPLSVRYPYNYYLGGTYKQTVNEVLKGGIGILNNDASCGDLSTGALCHPDGFPIMLYINGQPWGLYTLNLKKSKENYHIVKNDNDGKQLSFGDYMHEVFGRYHASHWDRGTILTSIPEGLDKWSSANTYNVGDYVYDEETFNFKVNGKSSSITLIRKFRCNSQCGASINDIYHISSRPSQIDWRMLEVRNPKKTICKELGVVDESGNQTYRYEYYDYDAPMNGGTEYTHELISSSDLTQAQAEALGFSKKEYQRSIKTRETLETYSYVLPVLGLDYTMQNLLDWGYVTMFDETKSYNVDDVVVYNNQMYKFTVIHEAGPWNESDVVSTSASSKKTQCKKDIFDEHHDLDFNYDFFLVYNDTDYYDSITHNTIYTMYDGKHLVANIYDTDISLGMSATYINGFPGVASDLLTGEFCSYLWEYHKDEIKARWSQYRNNNVITEESLESIVWSVVNQIGRKAFEDELEIWPDQPSYRKPTYWYMPTGSIKIVNGQHVYDETLNKPLTVNDVATQFSNTKNYVVGDYTIYNEQLYKFVNNHSASAWNDEDVESVVFDEEFTWSADKNYVYGNRVNRTVKSVTHSYMCSADCKNVKPEEAYTCGSPSSGGVYDSPRRTIEWWKKRLSYMDSLMGYVKN